MEKEVFFYSSGARISGKLNIPSDYPMPESGFPIVILSHGYGASNNEFGDFSFIASILSEIGIASLRFDFRGCGNSEYQLGRMLCGTEWVQDLRNAVSFACSIPGINEKKLCLIGESMGGSVAILAAASDDRVKCVAALSPIADGYEWIKQNWLENNSEKKFLAFLNLVEEDKKREAVYGYSNLVKMSDALSYKKKYLELIEVIHKNYPDNEFTYYVQYSSINSILMMKPIQSVGQIAPRPILLMAGKNDGIVPWENNSKVLYEGARQIKKMVVYDDGDHGLIAEPTRTKVVSEITSWLKKFILEK